MAPKSNLEAKAVRRNNDWKGRIEYEAKKKELEKERATFNTKEK